MKSDATKRILEFEGLRGLLSWWVVAGHLLLACGYTAGSLPPGIRVVIRGDYPVQVFIILSGFVIFKLIDDAREPFRVFLTRRFFRLYPVFLVCLAAAVALRPVVWSNLSHWQGNSAVKLGQANWLNDGAYFWQHLLAHLTLLHGAVPGCLLPGSAVAFLAPAWSISLEWQFYLVAPMLFWFLRKSGLCGWLVFGVCAIGGMWIWHDQLASQFPMNSFLPQSILFFWVGIISYYFWKQRREDGDAAAMFLMGICPLVFYFTLSIPLTLWSAVMALAMLRSGAPGQRAGVLLLNPSMQKLGRFSYSTYLVHICCIWLVQWLIFLAWPGISPGHMLGALTVVSVPVIYFASSAMHHWIEVPGMRLGRRLTTPRTPQ